MSQIFVSNHIISNFTTTYYNIDIKWLPVLECGPDSIYFLCRHDSVSVFLGLTFFFWLVWLLKTRISKSPGTCRMSCLCLLRHTCNEHERKIHADDDGAGMQKVFTSQVEIFRRLNRDFHWPTVNLSSENKQEMNLIKNVVNKVKRKEQLWVLVAVYFVLFILF